jgi:Ser-tRNA(Ala) deacylase AlaX
MKPIEGRLQTAEHILLAILKKEHGVMAGISRFFEDHGTLEVVSSEDVRKLDLRRLEEKVQSVADRSIAVERRTMPREEAEKYVDLGRVPKDAADVTVVDIVGFYKAACRDPHVVQTSQIGVFRIRDVDKVGKDRYRFEFYVD